MKKLLLLALLSSLFLWNCGDSKKDSTGKPASTEESATAAGMPPSLPIEMEVTPCTVTFTEDYTVTDPFKKEYFTIKAGETFIAQQVSSGDIIYILDEGPAVVDVSSESGVWPFETNCTPQEVRTKRHLGAFRDVVVYADAELTQEACVLKKGRAAPTSGGGYSGVSSTKMKVFRVGLGDFEKECGGIKHGYVEVFKKKITWKEDHLVPIIRFDAPKK